MMSRIIERISGGTLSKGGIVEALVDCMAAVTRAGARRVGCSIAVARNSVLVVAVSKPTPSKLELALAAMILYYIIRTRVPQLAWTIYQLYLLMAFECVN